MKTIREVVELLAGKYNPLSFAVYCVLASKIDEQENGVYHFTSRLLMDQLSFKSGFRPRTVSKDIVRTILNHFWEDGVFDFFSDKRGFYVRNKSDLPWPINISLMQE